MNKMYILSIRSKKENWSMKKQMTAYMKPKYKFFDKNISYLHRYYLN